MSSALYERLREAAGAASQSNGAPNTSSAASPSTNGATPASEETGPSHNGTGALTSACLPTSAWNRMAGLGWAGLSRDLPCLKRHTTVRMLRMVQHEALCMNTICCPGSRGPWPPCSIGLS